MIASFAKRNRFFKRSIVCVVLWLGVVMSSVATSSEQQSNRKPQESNNEDFDGIDYFHFWIIPQAQRQGAIESVYAKVEHPKILEFANAESKRQGAARFQSHLRKNAELYETQFEPTGSPFLYAFTGAIQTGRFEFDYQVFQWLSNIAFIIGVVLLGNVSGFRIWPSIALAIACFLVFRPLMVDISVGNVNRIQLFLFGVFIYFLSRNSTFYAGITIGFAIAFKLNFLFALVFAAVSYLLYGQWKSMLAILVGTLIGLLASVTIGSLYFGTISSWYHWRVYLSEFMLTTSAVDSGNYSLQAVLDLNSVVLTLGIVSMVLGVSCVVVRLKHSKLNSQIVINSSMVGLLVVLLSSPLVWSHYYVLAIPTIVMLVSHSAKVGVSWANLVLVISVVLLSGTFARTLNQTQIAISLQLGVWLLLVTSLSINFAQNDDLINSELQPD